MTPGGRQVGLGRCPPRSREGVRDRKPEMPAKLARLVEAAGPLARSVQRGLVSQLGLQDLSVNYDNLAVVRATWYPSVLCEGAFLMVPDQEAALRTPEYQERYALGIADGLENYFRTLGTR